MKGKISQLVEKLYILGGNKYWCFKNWQIWSMCVSAKISRLLANFCKKKVCRQSICWFFICWFFISFHNSPFHQTGILRHPPTSFVLITPPTIYDFPDFCSFLIVTTRVTWIYQNSYNYYYFKEFPLYYLMVLNFVQFHPTAFNDVQLHIHVIIILGFHLFASCCGVHQPKIESWSGVLMRSQVNGQSFILFVVPYMFPSTPLPLLLLHCPAVIFTLLSPPPSLLYGKCP